MSQGEIYMHSFHIKKKVFETFSTASAAKYLYTHPKACVGFFCYILLTHENIKIISRFLMNYCNTL